MSLDGAESKKLRLGLGYFSEVNSSNCANGTYIFLRYKSKAVPQGLVTALYPDPVRAGVRLGLQPLSQFHTDANESRLSSCSFYSTVCG